MTSTEILPSCTTRYFGTVEYEEDSVLVFPDGIPAFEQDKRFLALRQPVTEPLVFLQSLANPDLCFVTLPIQSVTSGFRLNMAPEDLDALGLDKSRQPAVGQDVLCLAVLSLEENGSPTGNLLAPIVVNLHNMRGRQAIQMDSPYSHREEIPIREASECS
jgi:flagellar assembly factor FliW